MNMYFSPLEIHVILVKRWGLYRKLSVCLQALESHNSQNMTGVNEFLRSDMQVTFSVVYCEDAGLYSLKLGCLLASEMKLL